MSSVIDPVGMTGTSTISLLFMRMICLLYTSYQIYATITDITVECSAS